MSTPYSPYTPTYDEVRHSFQQSYDQTAKLEKYNPYVLPYNTLGYTILIVYLQFSCYSTVRRYKYFVLFAICALSTHMLLYSRTLGLAYGLGVGPNAIWAAVLAWTLLVFREPYKDARRLVRKKHDVGIPLLSWVLNRVNGPEPSHSNGTASNSNTISAPSKGKEVTAMDGLEWQAMPTDFFRRLVWIHDLVLSFRQPHWDWQREDSARRTSQSVQPKRRQNPTLTTSILRFFAFYLAIDILKALMLTDPYFLSLGAASTPCWLPSSSPQRSIKDYLLIRTARSVLSYAGIFSALNLQFELTNLVSYHILYLGTIIGDSSIPELYEPLFGPFSAVLDDGLVAFWSRYWHGNLRFVFVSAGIWIARQLGYKEGSQQAKITIVIVAFLISGYGHGVCAYTVWGNRDRALLQASKAFAFFAVQPLGIVLQVWLLPRTMAEKEGRTKTKTVPSSRKLTNVLFVMAWLWMTCPLLNDPFADGGTWLLEPLPISFVRGLGFSRDRRWWCWPTEIPGRLVWDRERWWLSGFQVL